MIKSLRRLNVKAFGFHAGPHKPGPEVNKKRLELGLPPLCYWGSKYPSTMCMKPAVVRTTVSDSFDWRYSCGRHSKWPVKDRSRWLTYDGERVGRRVQRLVDGEWVNWEDFPIWTPTIRQYNEDNRYLDHYTALNDPGETG